MRKFDYCTNAMEYWNGRIDSADDFDAFRWHQWVRYLDLNEEPDLTKMRFGICFIGFCSEQGILRNKGRVGAALAPDFLRRQMSNLPCSFTSEVLLFDAGNIHCYNGERTLEESQRQLGEAVARILELGLFPIVLGGGHETTYGHYLGQLNYGKKQKEKPDLAVVNFDAHLDMRPYVDGAHSGSMFLQIADQCEGEGIPFGYMPIGIQQHSNTVSLFRTAQQRKVDWILAKTIQTGSYSSILEQIDHFMYHHATAYMTICTDVFSAAFAPAVSAPQALGLDPEVVIPIIKHFLRTRKIKGFDICEISPRFDTDNSTANLGAAIIFTVVSTLCKLEDLGIDMSGCQ